MCYNSGESIPLGIENAIVLAIFRQLIPPNQKLYVIILMTGAQQLFTKQTEGI